MPLAVGAAHYDANSNFRRLIRRYRDVMFMFWEPSVELRDVFPVFLRFPNYNFTQWSNGIMASTREGEYPRHIVSYELENLAPDVRVMLQRIKLKLGTFLQFYSHTIPELEIPETGIAASGYVLFQTLCDVFCFLHAACNWPRNLNALNQMIIWSYDNHTADNCFPCAAWFGACNWLKQNRDIWSGPNGWIPSKNACFAGQGMYSVPRLSSAQLRTMELC